jgi:hypothetical protein
LQCCIALGAQDRFFNSLLSQQTRDMIVAKQQVDNAAEFEEARRPEREVRRDQITSTVVEILVPAQTTRTQWEQLYRAVEYGKSRNVVVKITKGG